MKINQPLALNEQGIRENQEDSVWPAVGAATETSRTFVVCDGMGGHESGEVASNAVCTALANFVAEHPQGPTTPAEVEQAIAGAYDMLDRVDNTSSDHRMGTTLTLLTLTDSEAICAHIGDSRIYQVRPTADGSATIVSKSSDHSLVNELVKAQVITAEEALTHPKKNVITRAMQSIEGRRDAATLRRTNNVASGDYFLMCTDGVTEAVSDQDICEILGDRNLSDEVKLAKIKALCLSASHDNFSLYLVPISEGIQAGVLYDETSELIIPLPGEPSALAVEAQAADEQEMAEALDDEIVAEIQPSVAAPISRPAQAQDSQPYSQVTTQSASNPWKKVALGAIGVIVIAVVVCFVFLQLSPSETESGQPVQTVRPDLPANDSREEVSSKEIKASDLDEGTFSNINHRQGNREVVSDSRKERAEGKNVQMNVQERVSDKKEQKRSADKDASKTTQPNASSGNKSQSVDEKTPAPKPEQNSKRPEIPSTVNEPQQREEPSIPDARSGGNNPSGSSANGSKGGMTEQ